MRVSSPDPKFTGVSTFGPVRVEFRDGVAELDESQFDGDPYTEGQLMGIRSYMVSRGYGVDGEDATPRDPDPEPADPRDIPAEGEKVGTPLRDAAVDPRDGDFLAPIGAGVENPHGPRSVAPGIHAEGERAVRAGVVSSDPEVQDAAEKEHAQALLIDNEPADRAVDLAVPDRKDHGPLGLSDPGSVAAGIDGAERVREQEARTAEDDADGVDDLRGRELNDALDQAGLSKTGTVAEKRARLADHRGGAR